MAQSTYVKGLRETQRALAKLGATVDELKDIMAQIASEGAKVTAALVPVKTGALRNSVRGNRAKARATVTIGRGKSNNYAGVQNYGWPEKNIFASQFVEKTDMQFSETYRPIQIMDEGLGELIKKYGLD